jgi:PA14 domain
VTANVMVGMGGTGVGLGMQGGSGSGNGTGGGGMPFFGLKTQTGGALKGTFFDFKQDRNGRGTKMNVKKFDEACVNFAKSNMNENLVNGYFRGPQSLYSTQFYIPEIPSADGPAAFSLQGKVKPDFWIVHYKGRVSPPKNGTYHFVGEGDDVMYVKFDGHLVLDSCWFKSDIVRPEATYNYASTAFPQVFKKGSAIQVEAGRTYTIEVVIGDHGGQADACLLIEEEGVDYSKDRKGNPILPVFRLAAGKLPPLRRGQSPLPIMENGPVWKGVVGDNKPASGLDALKQSDAGAPVEPKPIVVQTTNKPDIVGNWNWFAGGIVTMTPDHRVEWHQKVGAPATGGGTWQPDTAASVYKITWDGTGFVDKVTLSADGQSLKGKNQKGTVVTGSRVP